MPNNHWSSLISDTNTSVNSHDETIESTDHLIEGKNDLPSLSNDSLPDSLKQLIKERAELENKMRVLTGESSSPSNPAYPVHSFKQRREEDATWANKRDKLAEIRANKEKTSISKYASSRKDKTSRPHTGKSDFETPPRTSLKPMTNAGTATDSGDDHRVINDTTVKDRLASYIQRDRDKELARLSTNQSDPLKRLQSKLDGRFIPNSPISAKDWLAKRDEKRLSLNRRFGKDHIDKYKLEMSKKLSTEFGGSGSWEERLQKAMEAKVKRKEMEINDDNRDRQRDQKRDENRLRR